MFNNLVNVGDFIRLYEKLKQGYGARILSMLTWGRRERVKAAWQHVDHPPKHWGSIPAVKRRWNALITGDPGMEPAVYVARKYFAGALTGLSVGCGTGRNEVGWMRTGAFQRIDAFDLSAERIQAARRYAEEEGLEEQVHFFTADIYDLDTASACYNVILVENALHHFSPLEEAIARLNEMLKPGGYLILRDFVGPSRFQWTQRQLEVVRGLLTVLPEGYRTRWGSGTIKRRFYRPGRLSMRLSDPSEAAESSCILPLLGERFECVEHKELGGTVLQLLFDDIAHHFLTEDETTQRLLDLCFHTEDVLLAVGALTSDFVFAIFRKAVA